MMNWCGRAGFWRWAAAVAVIMLTSDGLYAQQHGLVEQLQRLGWQSRVSDDGLLLTPPTEVVSATEDAVADDDSAALADQLRVQLLRSGWRLEEQGDGTLVFRRPPAMVKKPPVPAATPVQKHPTLADQLRAQLLQSGWRLEEQSDGTLVFQAPATQAGVTEGTESRAVSAPEQVASPIPESGVSDDERLTRLLQAAGWRAQPQEGGGLLFQLPKASSQAGRNEEEAGIAAALSESGRNKAGSDCSSGPELFTPSGGEKEILTESDVWQIANEWLEVNSQNGSQVGRIRKVLGVYLVSIVDRDAPYWLQHQVAVRAADGRLLPIY